MGYIEGQDRDQVMLLPDSIEDLVGEDDPVRVIDAFVDGLDCEKLGFSKNKPADTGRPAYNPKDLLKLYIHGYFKKIRSSRKLMKECRRNIELFYLLRRLAPDPEARVMQSKDGYHCYYNVQTAVDDGSHLIADYEVTNNCTDQGLLEEVASQARKMIGVKTVTVVVDKGYDSRQVYCRLAQTKIKGSNAVYANKEACHQCVNRCTASKQYKTVSFSADTQIVPVRLYGYSQMPPQTIPDGMAVNPYNHTPDRRDKPKRKVQLRIRSDTTLIKTRMCLSEHPFRTVKWYHDAAGCRSTV